MTELVEKLKSSVAGFGHLSPEESLQAVELIEQLKKENKELQCCGNCKHLPDNADDFIIDFTFCETCTRNKYHIGEDIKSISDNWEAKK